MTQEELREFKRRMKLKDRISIWIAWMCLPKRVIYYCAMRVSIHATTGKYKKNKSKTLDSALHRFNYDFFGKRKKK